jgi:1,4-alpha-glucan branching enzyme
MPTAALDTQAVLKLDGYLEPNIPAINARYDIFRKWKDTIDQVEGGYDKFTKGYLKFGLNLGSKGEVVYREWAPNAKEAYLIGDFSERLAVIRECNLLSTCSKITGTGPLIL